MSFAEETNRKLEQEKDRHATKGMYRDHSISSRNSTVLSDVKNCLNFFLEHSTIYLRFCK